ncbi:MAG: DMT family transporter [Anaerolineae bacterium]
MVEPKTAFRHLTAIQSRGYVLAISGTFLWSTTGPIIAALLANSSIAPLTLAAWRDIFACLALLLALAVWRRPLLRLARPHWPFVALYGVVLAAMNGLWTISVARNGAAISTVLVYTAPAFVALGSRWLFGERLGRNIIVALVMSLTGIALVAGLYDPVSLAADPVGALVGIGSAACWAAYSLFGKAAARRGIKAPTLMVYTFGVAGLLLLAAQRGNGFPSIGAGTWLGILGLSAIPTLGGYGLYTASLAYLPAATASLIAATEPALTAFLAWLFLGETLTPVQIVGSALIIGSVLALTWNGGSSAQ